MAFISCNERVLSRDFFFFLNWYLCLCGQKDFGVLNRSNRLNDSHAKKGFKNFNHSDHLNNQMVNGGAKLCCRHFITHYRDSIGVAVASRTIRC